MDQREFVQRRGNRPVRRPSRHNRPLRPLWIILGLVAVIVAVIVIVKLVRRSDEAGDSSSVAPPISSTISAPGTIDPGDESSNESTPEPADYPGQTTPNAAPEDMGSFMVADGVGYEYYHFDEETTNEYILAVKAAAVALSGNANLYDMVVPTSMDVLLTESYLTDNNVNSSDQRKAIDSYIYPSITAMSDGVKTIPLFTPLRQRCQEAIYFRTESTWTQLGGYYAYQEFCKLKGVEAVGIDQCTKQEYTGFLGSFYNGSQDAAMQANPDTVVTYSPGENTSLRFTGSDGSISEGWAVITDGSGYDTSYLPLIFAAGNQPYKVLTNNDLTDDSACVVVQDSFGNYFIPFLTQHYQDVYVVDYRYYSGSVPELVSEVGATDVILLSSVAATSDAAAVESISNLF